MWNLDSGALKGKLATPSPSAARDDDSLAELPPRSTAAARLGVGLGIGLGLRCGLGSP